jgi:class 3 adenylate cyclase
MKQFFSIQNLFLFAIIVVMPVCVAFYSINNMIEEQYLAEKEAVSRELKLQVAHLKDDSTTTYQIQDFFNILVKDKKICRQKPEVIKKFIEETDKKYPGAFKWIFLDEKYKALPINSTRIAEGIRYWEKSFKGGFYINNSVNYGYKEEDYDIAFKEYMKNRGIMQRLMGDDSKPEHIFEYNGEVLKSKWTNNECFVICDVDGLSYNQFGATTKIAGLCCLLVFPDALPKDIWYKRLIVRRQKSKENYKFPIAAINISESTSVVFDSKLPKNKEFVDGIINAYNSRTKDLFEYKNYIVGTTEVSEESEYRLLSLADMSDLIIHKQLMQLLLSLACIFITIISIALSVYVKHFHFAIISLRLRIATIFLIAMLLPLLSLISIGKTFISHEEGRLKESAYVKMRSGVEALSIRYKDTPRLIEMGLYRHLKQVVGSAPYDIDRICKGMQKCVDDGIINEYIFFKDNDIYSTSWSALFTQDNDTKAMKKTLIFMSKRVIDRDEVDIYDKNSGKRILENAVDEELYEIMKSVGSDELDFSRPSHLRHFVYLDTHFYFMTIRVVIDNKICPLFVYLKDLLVEKNFASREFRSNNMAVQEKANSVTIPEMSFFATLNGLENFPLETPIWKKLKDVLERSANLKIEETGIVNVENEEFLYLTKPLSSMNTKSYQPCLLTSTKPINLRIREVTIVIVALSAFALLGSFLLSLALSTSLLVPIKKIDSAAQQIGKGNLNVVLPEEGKDELARLSMTFNEMVKGLRERAKMRAYVSESVLEAVRDNSDQSVHLGKHIEATILFSDIRNFTGISEANTPDKIFEVLNEFLGGVEPIIRMNHGRVDKFIGDAVMAVFHQTLPEHHAFSAIKAAVRMKYFVSIMNKDRISRGLFPIEIGIGISTGHVLLGDVGSRRRKDLTVIGDEVNLASRLETASKQGHYSKIIFSGQTLKFIEDFVEADKMPFEEIRGKKNAVQIYEFIKFKDKELNIQEFKWK